MEGGEDHVPGMGARSLTGSLSRAAVPGSVLPMKTPLSATSLAIVTVLLTGCIRIDVTQTVGKNGEAQVEMLYDLSKLAEMGEAAENDAREGGELSIGMYGPASSSSSSQSSVAMSCAQFREEQGAKPMPGMTEVRCQDKAPNVILISGTQKLRRSDFIRRRSGKKTVYLYKVQNANRLIQSQQDGVERRDVQSNDFGDQLGKELASSILDGTFTVVMPGRIVSVPGGAGIVAGNKVTFQISDFPLKNGGFIRSQE